VRASYHDHLTTVKRHVSQEVGKNQIPPDAIRKLELRSLESDLALAGRNNYAESTNKYVGDNKMKTPDESGANWLDGGV
jgi:hypothetical protein